MRVLHLTDCHLPRRTGTDADGVDARATLARLLHDCRRLTAVDLVVVSGDVVDDGSREGYADALALIGAYARERGAAQVYCTGNHDDRAGFAAVLGTGHLDGAGRSAGEASDTWERAAVSHVGGWRVISLDSLVPGQVYGQLSPGQLTWLSDVLVAPAPAGSIVVLHHPPIALDREPQASVGLRDPHELADVLAGTDVEVVLCGHFHTQLSGRLGAVPVWVGPAVYSRIDLTAPAPLDRAVRGAAASVVELGGPASPLIHVLQARDPRAGETLYVVDTVSGEDVADDAH